MACLVQGAVGAKNARAFDIGAACSGFVYAMDLASRLLADGEIRKVMVVSAERLSKITDFSRRESCVLFGDGAGAAVLCDMTDDGTNGGLRSFVQYSDGARGGVLACGNRPVCHPFASHEPENQYVPMDGQAVYKFAVSTVPKVVTEAVEKAGLSLSDIDHFVLHQANRRIIESVAKRLRQPMEKFPMNLQDCGNISAASVPILLDSLNKNGMIKANERIVLAGFGAGLTWGAAVIQW